MTKATVPHLRWREHIALWLVQDYARLRALCIDLNAQVNDLRANGGIDPDELKAYAQLRVEHTALVKREQELGMWIFERFKTDIDAGRHAGKTLIEVLQMHMGEK